MVEIAPDPTMSGRSALWLKQLKSLDVLATVNGCPVWMLVMPDTVHPPNNSRLMMSRDPMKRCPGPMGTSAQMLGVEGVPSRLRFGRHCLA